MHGFRVKIAVASAAILTLVGVMAAASPATAADEVLRPGAQSATLVANTAWQPSNPVTRIAQQFVQPEDGNLANMSIAVFDIPTGHEFSSAAIHTFDPLSGPSAEPIAGGQGGPVTYAPDETIYPGFQGGWATIDFPDRPVLEEGVRYVLVIDPFTSGGAYVSFGASLFPSSEHAPWVETDAGWAGYATATVLFSSQLTTVIDVPDEPENPSIDPPAEEVAPPTNPTAPERIETAA